MRGSLRQAVRVRYDFQCGYCGVSETNIGAEMTLDHFLPRIHGGDESLENLVYCCHACNEFKGNYWSVNPELRLVHPLFDKSQLHFREQPDGSLFSVSERGANHIRVIRLNRPRLIEYRLKQKEIMDLHQQNHRLRKQLHEARQKTLVIEAELEHNV